MINGLTLQKAKEMLLKKQISSVELAKDYLHKIEQQNKELNAYINVNEEEVLLQAKKADEKIASGDIARLTGIPIAIKDVFCTQNLRTTASSKALDDFVPNYNADVIQKLVDEGCVIIGKTNMDEFAMGSLTINSSHGSTYSNIKSKANPELKLTPGGSSGGSCVAVSADMAIAAIGSDTGGSVRQPAAFCGIVGAKPTYGTCSRFGMISYASSFDSPGFFGKTVEDVALLMEIIAGKTPNDSMVYDNLKYDLTSGINNGIKGMKFAIPKEFVANVPDFIANKIEIAKKEIQAQGGIVDYVTIPNIEKSINVYYIITPAEMCSNLSKFDGIRYGVSIDSGFNNIDDYYTKVRSKNFGDEVKKRILIGNYILSSEHYSLYYEKAMKIRRLIKNEFDKIFAQYDAVISPTALNVAFDPVLQKQDPLITYMNDISTSPANIAGLPAISIPFGVNSDGLPIGMQVMCNRMEDGKMYTIAKALENTQG